jgi:hypothetical protein
MENHESSRATTRDRWPPAHHPSYGSVPIASCVVCCQAIKTAAQQYYHSIKTASCVVGQSNTL